MKTAILLFSGHHRNTAKLAQAIADAEPEVTIIDVTKNRQPDLSGFDMIVLASGIYAGRFADQLVNTAMRSLTAGMKVFLLYTSALKLTKLHTMYVRMMLENKGCPVVGSFRCSGYNTYGPFKLIGGTGKGHPDAADLAAAVAAFRAAAGEEKA